MLFKKGWQFIKSKRGAFAAGFLLLIGTLIQLSEFKNQLSLPPGHLIYLSGQSVLDLDFESLDTQPCFDIAHYQLTRLSKYQSNAFIAFSKDPSYKIGILDLTTKTFVPIISGQSPGYMDSSEGVFFIQQPSPYLPPALYFTKIDSPYNFNALPYEITNSKVVLPVSERAFVFVGKINHENTVAVYDTVTKFADPLPLAHCTTPLLWRSATRELLCYDEKRNSYFLNSLDGKNTTELNDIGTPIYYLEKTDQLIVNRNIHSFFTKNHQELFLYDIKTGRYRSLNRSPANGVMAASYHLYASKSLIRDRCGNLMKD